MDQENADRVLRALEKEKLEIFDVEENLSEPALTGTPPYASVMKDDQLPRSCLKHIDNISEAAYLAEEKALLQNGKKRITSIEFRPASRSPDIDTSSRQTCCTSTFSWEAMASRTH